MAVSMALLTSILPRQRQFILFCATVVLISVLMTLPLTQPLWDRISLLRFVLYPSRFLGLASVFLAVLAGGGVAGLLKNLRSVSTWLLPVISCIAIIAICGYGAFWQIPLFHPANLPSDQASLSAMERKLGIVGTTSIGEYAPIAVPAWPAEDAPIESKLLTDTLPSGSQITRAEYAPLRYRLVMNLPSSATLHFAQFYFQGWQAQVDGQAIALRPDPATGFIALDLLAGSHEIDVWFGSTPLRISTTLISLLSMLVLMGVTGWRWHLRRTRLQMESRFATSYQLSTPPSSRPLLAAGLGLITLIGFFFVKAFWVDRTQNLWRATYFDGATVAGLPLDAQVQFGDQLTLLGIESAHFDPVAQQVDVSLLWRVPQLIEQDYSVSMQIVDPQGQVIATQDVPHPDLIYPTSRWQPDQYVRDVHQLAVPLAMPPGLYQIRVGVYPFGKSDAHLAVAGHTSDPIVGTVKITRPAVPAAINQVKPQQVLSVPTDKGVELIGVDQPLNHLQVGDVLPLNLYWRAHQTINDDMKVCFSLRSEGGKSPALSCAELVAGFPTNAWQVNDLWRAPYRVRVPPSVAAGRYVLQAQLMASSTSSIPNAVTDIAVGELQIDAPAHVMSKPIVENATHARWPGLADLVGYTVEPATLEPGALITVTLVWQPQAEVASKYKVFVQLVDAGQNRAAGHDSTPADGAHPTTTWLAGEYITDVHVFTVPADWSNKDTRLLIGFYDEFTLQRLPLADGTTALFLEPP